jgi:hypothetical protein
MGYDLLWFACNLTGCDPTVVNEAIAFEQYQTSVRIAERSGVVIPGITSLEISPPEKKAAELLKQIDIEALRKLVNRSVPEGWTIIEDLDGKTSWESHGGAIQISWHERYVIGTGYGKFGCGVEALHEVLTKQGLTCFDAQTGKTIP